MTEKQKNIRSLIKTLAVLLTVTTLFFVFYYAILPLVNYAMIENSTIGVYIYYHQPKTVEEYNKIVTMRNRSSLSEVEPSFNEFEGYDYVIRKDGYNLLNRLRPEYVARFDGFKDCFIAEFTGMYYGKDGNENYMIMSCTPYGDDFGVEDITVSARPANAPSCYEFKKIFPAYKTYDVWDFTSNYRQKFDGSIDYSWVSWYPTRTVDMLILLKDGVALIKIENTSSCTIERIIPYEEAENVNGVPAKALIDLFNEHERSEDK